jgi:NADH-quinone oxidoreductase subunit M
MQDFPILSLMLLVPFVGAIACLFAEAKTARLIALAATLIDLALGIVLWANYDIGGAQWQFTEKLPLFAGFSWALGIDGIALMLIVLSVFLMPICIGASWVSIQKRVGEYMAAFLLMETLMIGVFAAQDLFLFYIMFEAGLIPMYLIIGVWGGVERIYASYKFFLYTLLGSVLMLIAMLWMANDAGTTDIPTLMAYDFPVHAQTWLWLAFFASFAVKMPMWPVHTWLPDAHVQAPTAGSIILAGVLLKMGGYGFIRFSLPMFPEASAQFAWLIFALSMIAVVVTSLIALAQHDMKKLIAYSSVAHMAIVTIGLFAFNPQGLEGSVIMMLSHGLVSGALFLGVGVIYDRLHTREIDRYGGLAINMPYYALFFMLFTMASVGLPGTSGFIGEFLSLIGIYQVSSWVALVGTTGVILSAAYMLYLYRRVIFGEQKNADAAALPDLSLREWAMMVPLAAAILWMGIYPESFIAPIRKDIAALDARLARAKPEGDARLTAGKPAALAEQHGAPAQENTSAQTVSGHEGAH